MWIFRICGDPSGSCMIRHRRQFGPCKRNSCIQRLRYNAPFLAVGLRVITVNILPQSLWSIIKAQITRYTNQGWRKRTKTAVIFTTLSTIMSEVHVVVVFPEFNVVRFYTCRITSEFVLSAQWHFANGSLWQHKCKMYFLIWRRAVNKIPCVTITKRVE